MSSLFCFDNSGDDSIQLIGERLSVFGVDRFGPRRFHSGRTELLHQISSCEPSLNRIRIEEFSAGANGERALFDHSRRQWDVAGDDQVIFIDQ